jgi:hypothetical protein
MPSLLPRILSWGRLPLAGWWSPVVAGVTPVLCLYQSCRGRATFGDIAIGGILSSSSGSGSPRWSRQPAAGAAGPLTGAGLPFLTPWTLLGRQPTDRAALGIPLRSSPRQKGRTPEHGSKGRAPERRSKGGAPEHRSKGGTPKRRSKGRAPERRSKGAALEHGSKGGAPERRSKGAAPEHGSNNYMRKYTLLLAAEGAMVERGLLPTLSYREKKKGGRKSIHSKDRIDVAARRSMGFRRPPLFWGRVADTRLLGLLRG